MAAVNVYGVEHTNTFQRSGAAPQNTDAALAGGRVRAIVETYTSDGTEGVGSTIQMGGIKLPKGAKVIARTLDHEDFGSSVTVALTAEGDASVSLSGAMNIAAAGIIVESNAGVFLVPQLASESVLTLTTAGATMTAAKTLKLIVLYTID